MSCHLLIMACWKTMSKEGLRILLTLSEPTEGCKIIRKHFHKDNVLDVIRICVEKYLTLTPSSLSRWQSDAEDYVLDELSEFVHTRLSPCTELFFWWFLRTHSEYGDSVGKMLTSWIVGTPRAEIQF